MIELLKYPLIGTWESLCKRPSIETSQLNDIVQKIIDDVRLNGDEAVLKYSKKFDSFNGIQSLLDKKSQVHAAQKTDPALKNAIDTAYSNIKKFHESQIENKKVIETQKGVECWRESRAIEKVGLYIPGGTAPLFSSVLMLGIPAQIAKCKEIILCTPADSNGLIHPAIIYAAHKCGIDKIFRIGGAQAIAALAFGTDEVPAVYKIFGPGNQYVTKAKSLVQLSGVAIDMPAGPSEVLVIADKTSIPEFVAADLLSQAEHGIDSQVILLSDNQDVLQNVERALQVQIKALSRKEISIKALENSKFILLKDLSECCAFSNAYAPEHLILALQDPESLIDQIENAGSVFLGNYSCESAGDYASGTNHTLPTNGYSKQYSGVSLDSFIKKITFQKLSEEGIKNIGPSIETMAQNENLDAHKNAVSIRLKSLGYV